MIFDKLPYSEMMYRSRPTDLCLVFTLTAQRLKAFVFTGLYA